MSEQPKIQFPVNGGYWQILAHLPSAAVLKYSATLHIGSEIACFVFSYTCTYVLRDSHELILDSTCINLGTEHNCELAAQFLTDTASHVGAAA